MPDRKQLVDINGHKLKLSNLNKVLYPNAKIVKAEIIDYYLKVSKWMLPFAKNRPLSMLRFPDGIHAHQFYSKNAPDWRPDWLSTVQQEGDENNYVLIQGPQDLAWLANIASLEIHAMNKQLNHALYTDHIILDLDPPNHFSYAELRDLTKEIGTFIESKGMVPFVKTSGSRGSHIYIPIVPTDSHDQLIQEVKALAKSIVLQFPKKTTNALRKASRKGRILIDINRNYKGQTTILPFSTRAISGAPISMPLYWADFNKTISSQDFTIRNAFNYLKEKGNAWITFREQAVDFLPKPIKIETHAINAPDWFVETPYKHMLATQEDRLIRSNQMVYENKWDGIRAFIYIWNGQTKIVSRSGRDITTLFPELHQHQEKNRSAVLDGEIVVTDKKGKPIFSKVISRMHSKTLTSHQIAKNRASFYAFDILRLGDRDLTKLPWFERRNTLEELLEILTIYKLSSAVDEGAILYEVAKKMDLEGIMIKDRNSPYLSGQRSSAWMKLKFRREAICVILGYTEGDGDRNAYFGSLHLAEIDKKQLIYRGRVGSGFNQDNLESYKALFDQLEKGPQVVEGAVEKKNKSIWFAQKLPICEIQYARLTEGGHFREPIFKKMEDYFYDI